MDHPTPEASRPELTHRARLARLAGCLLISGLAWSSAMEAEWEQLRWYFWLEVVLGVVAYALVVLRRRHPLAVGLAVGALSTGSGIAAGPATLAAVSVATRRQAWPIVAVGVVNFAAATTYTFTAPFDLQNPWWASVLINLAINAGMMGWGMFIGSRRELLWTLQRRAERSEAEQQLRVDRARVHERARIAREMHDVLAHRITQVSMTAGALTFREDLGAADLRRGLAQVQTHANQALHELRGVLGVLRDDPTGAPREQPQPTYDDVSRLVEEARRTGLNVHYADRLATPEEIPDAVGRAVFRIVQEGLTNVRKHAPGAVIHVLATGDPDSGVTVLLRNPLGFGPPSAPGAGLGLVGLAERVGLRGGSLDHRVEDEHFVLEAWLPWAA